MTQKWPIVVRSFTFVLFGDALKMLINANPYSSPMLILEICVRVLNFESISINKHVPLLHQTPADYQETHLSVCSMCILLPANAAVGLRSSRKMCRAELSSPLCFLLTSHALASMKPLACSCWYLFFLHKPP